MMPSRVSVRKLFIDLYPTEQEARRIAADAQLDISRIYFSNQAITNWDNILHEAIKQNQIDSLLDTIRDEYGRNPRFQEVYNAYLLDPTFFFHSPEGSHKNQEFSEAARFRGCFVQFGKFTLTVSLSIIFVVLIIFSKPLQQWLSSIINNYTELPTATPTVIILPSPVSTPFLLTPANTTVAATFTPVFLSTPIMTTTATYPLSPSTPQGVSAPISTLTQASATTVVTTIEKLPTDTLPSAPVYISGKFNTINVRYHPNSSAPSVAQIRLGETYKVVGQYSYWLHICCINESPVWVEKTVVNIIGNLDSVPTVVPSSTALPTVTIIPSVIIDPTVTTSPTSTAKETQQSANTQTPIPSPVIPTVTSTIKVTSTSVKLTLINIPTLTPTLAPPERTASATPLVISTRNPTVTPTSTPTPLTLAMIGCSLNPQEEAIAKLLTTHAEQKRTSLTCNPILATVARARAEDMGRRAYFAHINPDGLGPNYFVSQGGYVLPDGYGQELTDNNVESIGAGPADGNGMWNAWMASEKHNTHLLGKTSFFAEQVNYGIGFAQVPGSPYQYYWVFISAPPLP